MDLKFLTHTLYEIDKTQVFNTHCMKLTKRKFLTHTLYEIDKTQVFNAHSV